VSPTPSLPGDPRISGDPRFPGFPPELPPEVPPPRRPDVPSPPERPGHPHPGYPPIPTVPMPPPRPPAPEPLDDLRSRVYDQLLARRTVVLDRALDGETAMFVAAQLMTLDAEGTERITLIVNSPGGPLDAAATVLDTIDLVRGPVDTTCLGQAGGTAAVVVAAGTGRRRVGASAQLQLRLPEVELAGTATRVGDEAAHLRRLHDAIVDRLAAATGQDRCLLARDVDRGRVLPAPDAVAYGLVDEVIDRSTP
jgi:ATP-dependent Clp endopeptidase proteolytic subunit ClpP